MNKNIKMCINLKKKKLVLGLIYKLNYKHVYKLKINRFSYMSNNIYKCINYN